MDMDVAMIPNVLNWSIVILNVVVRRMLRSTLSDMGISSLFPQWILLQFTDTKGINKL